MTGCNLESRQPASYLLVNSEVTQLFLSISALCYGAKFSPSGSQEKVNHAHVPVAWVDGTERRTSKGSVMSSVTTITPAGSMLEWIDVVDTQEGQVR